MKKPLLLMTLICFMSFPAFAYTNAVFVPGTIMNAITFPLDVPVTLEYESNGSSVCLLGNIADDTQAEFNSATWDTTNIICPPTKPTWSQILSDSQNAYSVFNQVASQSYAFSTLTEANLVPSVAATVSSLSTSVSTINSGLPVVKDGATTLSNAAVITNSATVASGVATFYLTSDATSSGTALCPTGIDFRKAEISDASNSYNFSYALTNSNKTLTITSNLVTVILGTLGVTTAANGKSVNLMVVCH